MASTASAAEASKVWKSRTIAAGYPTGMCAKVSLELRVQCGGRGYDRDVLREAGEKARLRVCQANMKT